jgi:hypothetical protein
MVANLIIFQSGGMSEWPLLSCDNQREPVVVGYRLAVRELARWRHIASAPKRLL